MPTPPALNLDPALLAVLSDGAEDADTSGNWPAASWQTLRDAGVLEWSVPPEYGGVGLPTVDLLAGYEKLSVACLTTSFVLSQREAAVRRLVASDNAALKQRWLPVLARGAALATVGLSQLTTSRQYRSPALRASLEGTAFHLDGVIPWVTGADQADLIIIGATLPDDRQVLLALPCPHPGVAVEPALPLIALAGSRTSQVRCDSVRIAREGLLAGPAEKIMSGQRGESAVWKRPAWPSATPERRSTICAKKPCAGRNS